MEHFTFGRNNGLRVSALALGAGMFGSRWGYGADQADIPKIFGRFADAGGTFIDTAASYQLGSVRPRRIWIAFSTAGATRSPSQRSSRSVVPKAMACCR